MATQSKFPPLSSLNLRSISQTIARLDQYQQARFSHRFRRTVKHLARYIPTGGVVFDIGANHGRFAKELARLHGGSCRVYCFEPLEYNYTMLETIVRRYENVKVLRVALSNAAGEAELYVPAKTKSRRISPGSAHLGDESSGADFGTSTARDVFRQTIVTDTLDDVVDREGIDRLDFMKIDVQGAETLVLQGGRKSVETHRPVIYCELTVGCTAHLGLTVDEPIRLLSELGYEMFVMDERTGHIDPCPGFRPEIRDYLFLTDKPG